jgi:acetate CoA/acetoacetate CoA-transferase alpha subunit
MTSIHSRVRVAVFPARNISAPNHINTPTASPVASEGALSLVSRNEVTFVCEVGDMKGISSPWVAHRGPIVLADELFEITPASRTPLDLNQGSILPCSHDGLRQAWVLHMKTVSVEDAVAMIPEGAILMIGGFMGVGTPERIVDELVRQGKRNLTVIANDTAVPGRGIGKLVDAGLVSRTVASHIGLNPETQRQMIEKKMEVDLVPQGTLIERIRAGGCGLGGVLTPTGVGTVVEEGKQKIEVDGKSYLLETALHADFALISAFLADYLGNLSYVLTSRNFNPIIAMAADTTIVAADHIVPVGLIAPDHVVTPAPLVDYLVVNG